MQLAKTWDMIAPPLYLGLSFTFYEQGNIPLAIFALLYGLFRVVFSFYPIGYRFKRADAPSEPDDEV